MKYRVIINILLLGCLVSCFDDKGNYTYHETGDIIINNVPDIIEVLGSAENITVIPEVISTQEGPITGNNPNFSFSYLMDVVTGGSLNQNSGERWIDLNPSGSLNLDTLATFAANNYYGWFRVKDIRTGIETSKVFNIRVTSPTYEGWLVLCNEGDENRVRLDMVSVISSERTVPAYDILTPLGLPVIHGATQIGFYPNRYSYGDMIFIMSEEGAYKIDRETFVTDQSWDMRNTDFIVSPGENEMITNYMTLNSGSIAGALANFCVSKSGNAYVQVMGLAGAAFESPVNTSVRAAAPEYRVAPFIGVSQARPGNGRSALFYDIDNRRFVGWRYGTDADLRQVLSPLPDPEDGKLFSFNTDMELIYMEGTRFSNGLVYSILQDRSGKRHIYAINMADNGFVQENIYEDIDAVDFDKATCFAFHSQFPFLFYSAGKQVYLYHLARRVAIPMNEITLGANEEITLLKFNLYLQTDLTVLNDQSDEFMLRQFDLMVGSYDNDVPSGNGGRLGFYKVDGTTNSISKKTEYDGFARIKDVVYRERR